MEAAHSSVRLGRSKRPERPGAAKTRRAQVPSAPQTGRQAGSRPSPCRVEFRVSATMIDVARSAARIERDIEHLAGADYTLSSEAIRRYAYTPVYRNTLDYFTPRARGDRLRGLRGPGRDARRPQQAARRAGVRDRLALRLEPERRQVRRHDGRRHRARGLPPERGARPRPAAAADLVPRGGGLGLRPDAARQPDRGAARHRGGAERAVPRDRRRAELLGARRGGGLRAGALARVQPRARRPDRLDRDAHRAGARAPGHRQPDRDRHRDRRLRPRRRRRPRARRPRRARRRWTSGSTRRCRWPSRSSSSSGSPARQARGPSARSARSRSTPG